MSHVPIVSYKFVVLLDKALRDAFDTAMLFACNCNAHAGSELQSALPFGLTSLALLLLCIPFTESVGLMNSAAPMRSQTGSPCESTAQLLLDLRHKTAAVPTGFR